MSDTAILLVFRLDERRYALPLDVALRVVHAVYVTPLPGAPAIVAGVIDVGGTLVPVLNIRRRFRLPERPMGLADHFLIAQIPGRTVALMVDQAEGVIERAKSAIVGPDRIAPGAEHFLGVVRFDDGLILIQDLEKFLSLDEARALDDALCQEAAANQNAVVER